MALLWKDRVLETSTTTGTGALTLAGAVAGFRTFASIASVLDTFYYFIEAVTANGVPTGEWETGLGTYSAANTLTRTTVLDSSNAGLAVNFSAGTKRAGLTRTAVFPATGVVNTPAGNIAATEVQAAINELDTEKVAKAGDTMTGALTISLASGNSLIVDTNTLVVDATNNRVGITDSAPAFPLDIGSFGSTAGDTIRLKSNGSTNLQMKEADATFGFTVRNIGGSGLAFIRHSADATGVTAAFIHRDTGDFYINGTSNITIDFNRLFRLRAYTVATLPAAGTAGRKAYVTDALAPTYLATLVGGGAVVTEAFDNGTNWVGT